MNQKNIGVLLVVISIIFSLFVIDARNRELEHIENHMRNTGSCFLEDGTCLHAEMNAPRNLFGWLASISLFSLGIYLIFFDKTQQTLLKQNLEISKALEHAEKSSVEKEKFNAFLSTFSDDEKKVLTSIREQEGITQSTLRFRTDISKATLSLMLKHFEEKGIISRNPSGKTNKIYLIKKF